MVNINKKDDKTMSQKIFAIGDGLIPTEFFGKSLEVFKLSGVLL